MDTLNNLITNFSVEKLQQFFRQKISTFKSDDENYEYLFESNDYEDITKIGEADLKNSDELLVISAKTLVSLTNRTGKKRQFEIAKKILSEENKDAAFFIFYDESGNFRFSFVKANFVEAKKYFTDFKRYTYFVSPSQTNKTFKQQINACDYKNLDSILQAFSVEPLNKQFYEQIAKAFYSLIDADLKLPSKTNRKNYQEFAVRLIGRTIFVWFLKNKTSENHLPLIPNDWLTSQKVKETPDYYHQLLEKLFFEILNKPIDERIEDLPKGQKIIPFLNGGLFEPKNDDFYGAGYINTLKIPNEFLKNFFATLEQFHFTIDENSINDTEVSIDPEMLGTIFENLLAEIDPDTEKSARKSTGSFYIPREIVDYMVEESLVSYLKSKTKLDEEKLHDLFKENNLSADDFENREQIINAFNEIKILDPACGSGAFPMGALHKINMALQKLDPDAKIWKQKQLSKIDNVAYRNALKDKLDKSNVEYIRKLGIIQHSIYGVDIQTIATEISKLRSFLSLVVDENINDKVENRGIYPLPNLEFKFVTANSLIGLEEDKPQATLDYAKTNSNIEDLQNIREEYLQAYGNEKEDLKEQFLNLQKDIAQKEFGSGAAEMNKKMQLIGWNPFKHEESNWFNPKWMFGVEDFDVVIGNPPYIQLQKAIKGKEKYADLYKEEKFATFERTGDIYALFYEKGINLLNKNGFLCYITSNKWMRANHGKSLRKFFSDKKPIKLIDLGPGVFNTATVDTNILLIENSEQEQTALKALTLTDKEKINTLSDKDFTILTDLSEDSWIILSQEEYRIKQKIEQIGTPLKDWDINIKYGIRTGFNQAFIINGKAKDEFIAQDPKNAEIIKPILRGRDIKKYKAEFADLWIILVKKDFHNEFKNNYPILYNYVTQYEKELKNRGQVRAGSHHWIEIDNSPTDQYLKEFEKEKIVWKRIGSIIRFSYSEIGEYCLDSTVIAIGKYVKYLTALLNSKLHIKELLKNSPKTGTGDVIISVQALNPLTVHLPNDEVAKPFEILVDLIIFAKENGLAKEAEKFESVIDGLVYDLYFEDEMKKANCYITDRITEVIKPFEESQTDEEKTDYIKKFYNFCSKDKIIFHSLIHRRTIKVVQIINGNK